jgi:hypothetical protein
MAGETRQDRKTIRARLSTFDTAMVVFSLVVGIGIFRTPAIVAGAAGGTSLFFAAWIAGGFISLIGALTFAGCSAAHPRPRLPGPRPVMIRDPGTLESVVPTGARCDSERSSRA